jgi:hypothetical protein
MHASSSHTALLLLLCALLMASWGCVVVNAACEVANCAVCMTANTTMCSNCEGGYMLSDAYKCEKTTSSDSGDGVMGPCSLISSAAVAVLLVAFTSSLL